MTNMKKLLGIINGEPSKERTLLANALLIELIKRKPLTFEKCQAILELIYEKTNSD